MRTALVASALACLLVATASNAARAASERLLDAPKEMRYVPNRVALLPLRDYAVSPSDLFATTPSPDEVARHRFVQHAEEALTDRLRTDPRVDLVSLSALPNFDASADIVRQRFELGKDFYDNLDLPRATANLEEAEEAALAQYHDVVHPEALAEVELYLGLSLLEGNRGELAHISFKRMFALTPTRRFPKGYYPARAEKAFAAALTDLLATTTTHDLVMDLDRLEALMDALRISQVVSGHVSRDGDGSLVFQLVVYDRPSRAFVVRDELALRTPKTDAERLDRIVSAWLACTPVAVQGDTPDAPRPKLHPGTYIDTNFSHAFYLDNPAREQFHNVGFAVNVAGRIRDHFDLFSKITLYTTLPDPLQDLQTTLNSARLVAGAGITFGNETLRAFIHPGLDLHYLGQFEVITDANCKFFGRQDPKCNTQAVTSFAAALLFGVNISAGLDIMLTNELYLNVQANFAIYFPFNDASSDLNFLTGYEAGAGVHF